MDRFVFAFLFLLTVALLPFWSHSARWGYSPSGGVLAALGVLLCLKLFKLI